MKVWIEITQGDVKRTVEAEARNPVKALAEAFKEAVWMVFDDFYGCEINGEERAALYVFYQALVKRFSDARGANH